MRSFYPGEVFKHPNGDVGYVVVQLVVTGTYYADDDGDGGEVRKAGPECLYQIDHDGTIRRRSCVLPTCGGQGLERWRRPHEGRGDRG